MFMDSSGHRANILGKAWDVIGDRRLQGPDRQEDVDRPVRRQVRLDLDRAQADAQADPEADPAARHRDRRRAQGRPPDRPPSRSPPTATPEPTPVLELAPTAEPTPPLGADDLLPGDEPRHRTDRRPDAVQPSR